jgi:hypothetical protein
VLLGWALWTLANAVTQSTTVITKPWRQESMIPDCTRGTIGAFVDELGEELAEHSVY